MLLLSLGEAGAGRKLEVCARGSTVEVTMEPGSSGGRELPVGKFGGRGGSPHRGFTECFHLV